MPPEVGGSQAAVAGEFNNWSRLEHPMIRGSRGFTVTISLPAGATYRFRYLIDATRWENDWDADAYLPNAHGQDDSVVDLTSPVVGAPAAPPAPAIATKKAAKTTGATKKAAQATARPKEAAPATAAAKVSAAKKAKTPAKKASPAGPDAPPS
ncbi:MAG TPA: isoamylase early set domain-containing protein [Acidimicrobiales bacterium]|nr:isoamylase early set domain-containing protein [Acidimicrobiales bacterium]